MPSTTQSNDLPNGATADDLDDVLAPEMTEAEAAQVRPIRDAPQSLRSALPKSKGGRPRLSDPKVHVSLRLDPDVLAAYKATGDGWQTRINDALRNALKVERSSS